MKNRNKVILLLLIFIIIAVISYIPVKLIASNNVEYKDYNQLETLNSKYSYGTLFWTDKTQVIDLNPPSEDAAQFIQNSKLKKLNSNQYVVGGCKNQTLKFKITNCATDEDGEMCDVVVTINNITEFEGRDNYGTQPSYSSEWFGMKDGERVIAIGLGITKGFSVSTNRSTEAKYISNNIMRFNMLSNYSSADFKMEYYKSGTNKSANINGTVAIVSDIDITNQTGSYTEALLRGNEGIVPGNNSTVYYSKNDYLTEAFGGISTPTNKNYYAFEGAPATSQGITESTSSMIVQDGKATYTMTYSGNSCGIDFIFISAAPYELDTPIKTVDVEEIAEKTTFHYKIKQYVPNNYYTSLLDINNNNNNSSSSLYSKLEISDELNENLKIVETETDKINIVNKDGRDCTNYFTITQNNNKVVATAKSDKLKAEEFYNEMYTLTIPVQVKEGSKQTVIKNSAKTLNILKEKTTELQSNDVEVKLQYDVKLNVRVINGLPENENKQITVSAGKDNIYNVDIKPNEGYILKSVTVDGENIDISSLTNNNGVYTLKIEDTNILQNIEHIVNAVCESNDAIIKVKYVDEEGKEISESSTINSKIGSTYQTVAKNIKGYTIKEIPANSQGVVQSKQTIVTYIYSKEIVKKYEDTVNIKVTNGTPKNEDQKVIIAEGGNNTFTVIIKPNEGYTLKTLVVDGKNIDIKTLSSINGKYTYEITDKDIRENLKHTVVANCELLPKDETIAKQELPKTGKTISVTIIAIIILTILVIYFMKKMKDLKDIK